ncbi:hypothetical protein HDU76_009763, partial [Blyttiomyces sp. JEL0837]
MIQDMGPYIPEWIEHHHMLGIDHFILFNNKGTDNSEEILKPYIDEGIVEWIPYPPAEPQNVSIANGGTEANLKWFGEKDRDIWLQRLHRCRNPTGHIQCQEPAFLETLAAWRNRARWIITFDVDEFFYVSLYPGAKKPKTEADMPKISDTLKRLEHRDMVSVVGTSFGTQGYLQPPDDAEPGIPFPTVSQRYFYHSRFPFHNDYFIKGFADARKSFANPRKVSSTAIHDWVFDDSPTWFPSKLRIHPPLFQSQGGVLRMNHYQYRAVLWIAVKAARNHNPALRYHPIKDEFLNDQRDFGMTYLAPFVKDRIVKRLQAGAWKGIEPYKGLQAFSLQSQPPPYVEKPDLCIALSYQGSSLPRLRKALHTILYHMENHEPSTLKYEVVIALSLGAPHSDEVIEFIESQSFLDTNSVRLVEARTERGVMEEAISMCKGRHVLTLQDHWETRIVGLKSHAVGGRDSDAEDVRYLNGTAALESAEELYSEIETAIHRKRRGGSPPKEEEFLHQSDPPQYGFTDSILAAAVEILDSEKRMLE